MKLLGALLAYLVARIRAIGHDHVYGRMVDGVLVHTNFCTICGKYPRR